MKFNNIKLSALVVVATFLFSTFMPVSEAHILVIGDSDGSYSQSYDNAKSVADMLKSKNYAVVELYRENATTKNILKGMYGADAVIYAGHGGYEYGNYEEDGGPASPPFALVGTDDFLWGIGSKMREGLDGNLFTAPFKKNIPVILMGACFSTGWVGYSEVANPTETIYNFAKMFTGAGANYYSTGYGPEIIQSFLDGAVDFADANNKNYETIKTASIFNGTPIWRNPSGASAFVGNWSGKFPSVSKTTPYDDIAAEKWYISSRKVGYTDFRPTVTSIDPVNNTVNVPTNKIIKVKFSKSIKSGTNYIELKGSNGKTVPFTKSISSNILTIKPANLTGKIKYTLILHTGCVTDLTGKNLTLYTSSFTADGAAPAVKTIDPANRSINVAVNKVIKVTFNEAVKKGTNYIELKGSDGKTVPFTKSISNNVLTIKPTSYLTKGIKYTLILHTGSLTDLSYNPITLGTFSFTTTKI